MTEKSEDLERCVIDIGPINRLCSHGGRLSLDRATPQRGIKSVVYRVVRMLGGE